MKPRTLLAAVSMCFFVWLSFYDQLAILLILVADL